MPKPLTRRRCGIVMRSRFKLYLHYKMCVQEKGRMLAASSGPFGCTLKELRELMELRGHDACERIRKEYGTVDEICRRLRTSSTDGQSFTLSRA